MFHWLKMISTKSKAFFAWSTIHIMQDEETVLPCLKNKSWSWKLKKQVFFSTAWLIFHTDQQPLTVPSSINGASLEFPHCHHLYLSAFFGTWCYFSFLSSNPPHRIYGLYNSIGYNCFIAAGVYVLVGLFSWCQIKLNKRKVGKESGLCFVDF